MSTEKRNIRRMVDLEDGKDYLVDYYSLFGVDREVLAEADTPTSEAILKASYREKNLQYHPDRYLHLSPSLKIQAEQVHRSVLRGYDILIHPSMRDAYNKRLAEWKGPISENGFPIYDWNFQADISRGPMTDEQIAEAKGLISDITGYNPNTHALLERLSQADNNDEEIREALDKSLLSKEIFMGIEEQLRWEQAGVPNHPLLEEASPGYLDKVKEEVEKIKAEIPKRASQLLLEAKSGKLLLKSAEGENRTQEVLAQPEKALALLEQALLKPIQDAQVKLEALAKEREETFTRRLDLSMEYKPQQKKLRPNLVVCVDSPKGRLWSAFRLTGTDQVNQDESLTRDQLSALADPACARTWIKKGWSVMVLKVREGLDVPDQFRAAIMRHFEKYLIQEEGKNN